MCFKEETKVAEVSQQQVDHSGPVYAVAFSPDGRQCASGSGSFDVRLSIADLESPSRPRSVIEWCSHPFSRELTARGCVLGACTGLGSVQAALIAQLLEDKDEDY